MADNEQETNRTRNGAIPKGPWTCQSQTKVYDNSWISVSHEEVLTPGGTTGVYGVVHFKNRAIGVVPIDKQGNTRLVGQFRYTLNEYSWEIPEGGGPLDEEPLLAAKRELQEETGLHGGRWQQLMKIHVSNSVTDEEGYLFLAKDLDEGEQNLEPTESDLVVQSLPLADAIAMVRRGDITDVMSVAALLAVENLV